MPFIHHIISRLVIFFAKFFAVLFVFILFLEDYYTSYVVLFYELL
jgi:hypothetical protein